MTRRWRESAARARRYRAAKGAGRVDLRASSRFIWVRRARSAARGAPPLVVHVRFGVTLGVHVRRDARLRGAPLPPGATRLGRQRLGRDTTVELQTRTFVRSAAAYLRVRTLRESRFFDRQRVSETRHHDWHATHTAHSRVERWVTSGTRYRQPDANAVAPSVITTRETTRLRHTLSRQRVTVLQRSRMPRVAAIPSRRRGETPRSSSAATQPVMPPAAPQPAARLDRGTVARPFVPPRAFAVQRQPLAVAAAKAPPLADEPPSVERIERTLRESLTVVAERTARREIQRTLAPGASLSRRLRETIQSGMADDIVFERERRGER